MLKVILLSVFIALVAGDCYLHNPRGSVNRLNENSANTQNQARLCDTQNNNNGGYCWGPSMHYFVGSQLSVEWTNQHSCGQQKNDCQIVLQYMCGVNVRDGTTTTTITDDQTGSQNPQFGMHETYEYYQACKTRERNKGLFTADRNLNNNAGARATRQNNNGNRRGFECPEERDYYPYWHPTPWKDIAILTTEPERCEYYQMESQNVKGKNYCSDNTANNQAACTGTWELSPPWKETLPEIEAPYCGEAPWSRDNHLGNGLNGFANTYNWTIPNDPNEACVFRIRYNISSHRTPWDLNSSHNGVNSPVKNDPYMYFHPNKDGSETHFRLAIDTSQFGRTFQDRSHVFAIKARPADVDPNRRIFNLNVRGKRGNIVQAYPAVEYDFVPNILHVKTLDYIHFQWTGCDTNPNNFAGEGRQGTDRSNIVILEDIGSQYFRNLTNNPEIGGDGVGDYMPGVGSKGYFFKKEVGQRLAWIDQEGCTPHAQLNNNADQDLKNCAKLNAATTPYFNGGVVRVERTGTVNYISSRNNNFTNRGQKGVLISTELVATFGIVLLAVSSVVFAAGVIVAIGVKVSASVASTVVGA